MSGGHATTEDFTEDNESERDKVYFSILIPLRIDGVYSILEHLISVLCKY